MPDRTTVYDWLLRHDEFARKYARAREIQADHAFDRIAELSEATPERDMDGKIDPGDVAHRRLAIDAHKWRAGKLRPRVYGDKIQQEHSGPGGAPIQVVTGVPGLDVPPSTEG